MQHRVLLAHEPVRALDDEVVHMLQRHAVGRERAGVVAHLFLQARHADFEELVEIAAGDADEAESFEKRDGGVGGLREHAFVESQNAQFAVEKRIAYGHR